MGCVQTEADISMRCIIYIYISDYYNTSLFIDVLDSPTISYLFLGNQHIEQPVFYHNSHVEVWGKLMCPMLCTHGWNNQTHEELKRQHSHICKITYMQSTYMAIELLLESRLPDRNSLLQYRPWQMCQELKNKENQQKHNYQLIKKTPCICFLFCQWQNLVPVPFLVFHTL